MRGRTASSKLNVSLQEFYFTNEVVSVVARRIVPFIVGRFIEHHAVHGRPCIWFPRRPARVLHGLQVVLARPHPLLIAHDVVATRPPAFGNLVFYKEKPARQI